MSQLNPNEWELEAYCREWIANGGNQRHAWRKAFPNSTASDSTADNRASLLHNSTKVQQRLAEIRNTEVPKEKAGTILTKAEVMERLTVMSNTKPEDFFVFIDRHLGEDELGLPVIMKTPVGFVDFKTLPEAKRACVKSMAMTRNGPKIELYDAQTAFRMLADLNGWNAPRGVDLTSSDRSMSPKKNFNEFYDDAEDE